ncbi:hypothetical protein [Bacillus sp. JJ1474]|uniref:hypothetical protein n=1 Tax=Bacillus sp. JJ1474 TaxID=3122955 RepID=UPI003000594F
MKKKAIKLATSTAIAASAFVAAAPANQADAAVNVDQLVQDAQNAGTVLKWAISVEGSADYVTRPYAQYNAAKKAIEGAQNALKGASASDKLKYEARLTDPQIQVKRAAAYIDAITSSEKIKELTASLDAAVKSDDIEKVETAYHKATAEYRKQSALLDRVYGQSTRDGIRNAVKPAIEKLVADTKNDVTVNMLAKAAAADVKAGKLVDAGKKVAEAQAILDANVLKWETSLQKSVNDVVESMPLAVTSVTRVDSTTLTVKFNKAVDGAHVADYTFDNDLLVTEAKLGTDKKTVTLTVTGEKTGKTYKLFYKNVDTGISYSTAAAPGNPNIDVDAPDTARLDVDSSRSYVFTLKNHNGSLYNGDVTVDLEDLVAEATADPLDVELYYTDSTGAVTKSTDNNPTFIVKDGKLNLFVKGLVAGKFAPVTYFDANGDGDTDDKNEKLTGGTSIFLAPGAAGTGEVVDYVDLTNNYFATAALDKFNFDSNDIYRIKGQAVTFEQFKAALSKKDEIDVINYYTDKNAVSVFNITKDYSTQLFSVNKFAERVDTPTYTVSGTGTPGTVVVIKDKTSGNYVNHTEVSSNGTWRYQLNLSASTLYDYTFSQVIKGTENTAGEQLTYAGAEEDVAIYSGKFAISAQPTYTALSKELEIVFSAYDDVKVKDGATITLRDSNSTYVYTLGKDGTTYSTSSADGTANGDITDGKETLTITLGVGKLSAGANDGLSDQVVIDGITNVTNQSDLRIDFGNWFVNF